MKIPFYVTCYECHRNVLIWADVNKTLLEGKCECGQSVTAVLTCSMTIGFRLLERSRFELVERRDYCLSIVFSATSFECELSRLYFKWHRIGAQAVPLTVSNAELESLLRRYRSISERISEVSKLMAPEGFQEFTMNSQELSKTVAEGVPSLDLSDIVRGFQEKLFWPRNRILHLGKSDFDEMDARRAFGIATLGLKILEQMDKKRSSQKG